MTACVGRSSPRRCTILHPASPFRESGEAASICDQMGGVFVTYFECTQGGLGRRPVITFFQFR
jgi:hypothetical protein